MKHGDLCHVEIPTSSVENARRFYGGLFGWTFAELPGKPPYTIFRTSKGGVGGGLWNPPPGAPRHVTNYVLVRSLDEAVEKVTELGGRVCTDRMEVPGWGSFRIVTDPDQNSFGLWEAAARKPAPGRKSPRKRR